MKANPNIIYFSCSNVSTDDVYVLITTYTQIYSNALYNLLEFHLERFTKLVELEGNNTILNFDFSLDYIVLNISLRNLNSIVSYFDDLCLFYIDLNYKTFISDILSKSILLIKSSIENILNVILLLL